MNIQEAAAHFIPTPLLAAYSVPNNVMYLTGLKGVIDRQSFVIEPDMVAANSLVQVCKAQPLHCNLNIS